MQMLNKLGTSVLRFFLKYGLFILALLASVMLAAQSASKVFQLVSPPYYFQAGNISN